MATFNPWEFARADRRLTFSRTPNRSQAMLAYALWNKPGKHPEESLLSDEWLPTGSLSLLPVPVHICVGKTNVVFIFDVPASIA